jgi:hypothetical protein
MICPFANYQEVSRRLDLTNFVDYLLVNIYAATGDRATTARAPGACPERSGAL